MDEEIARRVLRLENQVISLTGSADAARRTRHDLLEATEDFARAATGLVKDLEQIRKEFDSLSTSMQVQSRLLDSGMELTDQRFDFATETFKAHHARLSKLEAETGIVPRPPQLVAPSTGNHIDDLQETSKHVTQLAKQSSSGGHNLHINLQLGKLSTPPKSDSGHPPGSPKLSAQNKVFTAIAALLVALSTLVTAVKSCNEPAPHTDAPKR